jgi:hypothetical protein
MAAFGGITSTQVTGIAVARLQALRRALEDCQDMNQWLAGLSQADLTNIGFAAGDANTLKSAFADAGALQQLYDLGTLPGTYTLPYTFGASQRAVLGPQ